MILRAMRSRMEIADLPDDTSNVICCCGHSHDSHDWPNDKCLVKGCDCRSFERYVDRGEEDGHDE